MTFGPYRIGERIGAGGMGEVYRASDSRLGRDVALKLLPAGMTGDPERRARFLQEAQSASRLNHPNIVTVYDIGESDGRVYIAMEYVAGRTLDALIPRDGLPLAAVLKYAIPIAGAVARAHAAGIVHRDLKPGNIMLTPEGVIKVLDFGLAKIVDAPPESEDTTRISAPETQSGSLLGTPAFMSPEQAEGNPVDARSDVFSFGSVLYQMIAGKLAFQAASMIATMAAVLHKDPPPLSEGVPLELRNIVARCLRKDPERRFQSMADVRVALVEVQEAGLETQPGTLPDSLPPVRPKTRRGGILLASTIALTLAAIALLAGHFLWPTFAPPAWTGNPLWGPDMALNPRPSPDGHTLAFVTLVARQSQVAVMRPDSGNWSVLTHNQERGSVTSVTWSPDGSRIYYDRVMDTPRGVYSVPVVGGEEELVLEDAMFPKAMPDGSLIVARNNSQRELQLFRFSPDSGRLQPLPMQVNLEVFSSQVRAFPDGREIVVVGAPTGQSLEPDKDLYVMDVATGHARRLVTRDQPLQIGAPAVTRDGRSILFAERGPYQVAAVERDGSSQPRVLFPLTSNVWSSDTGAGGSVYLDQLNRSMSLLRFSPRGGHAVEIARFPLEDYVAEFAALPDGRAVWSQQTGNHGSLVIVAEGKDPVPLSGAPDETTFPVSLAGPDQIAFAIGKDRHTIGIASISTGRIVRRIAFGKGAIDTMLGSPDGQRLYCTAGGSIWMQPAAGGPPTRLRAGAAAAMDPEGKYMAVIDVFQGRARLLKVPLDGGPEREIPISGNSRPAPIESGSINRDGKLLLGLQSPDSWFVDPAVIDMATGRATRIPIDSLGDSLEYAWTPDGQIMATAMEARASIWKFQPQQR
jgi:eukaryotic-like serine/threonine-protein kinase